MIQAISRRAVAASCLATITGFAALTGTAGANVRPNASEPTITVWPSRGRETAINKR